MIVFVNAILWYSCYVNIGDGSHALCGACTPFKVFSTMASYSCGIVVMSECIPKTKGWQELNGRPSDYG